MPGFEHSAIFGVGAPRDTPKGIIERLNAEINVGLADPKAGTFRRPYTKKKNAANARKKSVKPNIFASYLHTELICFAGKNAIAMPSVVVIKPKNPETISVPRL